MATTVPARIGPICCVTITVPDLGAVESLYTRYFDYRVIDRGTVGSARAAGWGTPAHAEDRYLLLAPAAGDECVFRFIEYEVDSRFTPFSNFGWNAAEIMVQDVDQMAQRLAGSDFEIVGEPQDLSFNNDIRAMQVLGPGRELLYLTQFKRAVPGLEMPPARCAVDSVFIIVLAGPDMTTMQDWYYQQFDVPKAPVVDSRVKAMSAAFGLSPEQRYPIAALPVAGHNLIEVDEMPASAKARPARAGALPTGIAMVSFMADADTGGQPVDSAQPPYRGCRGASVVTGSAGELIELIQRA